MPSPVGQPRHGGDAASRAPALEHASLPAAAYRAQRRVRFSDCDPAGIVYTPRYFDLLNGVLEDFFPDVLGLDYHGYISSGVGLGYAHVRCDFFSPGHMGDDLIVTPLVEHVGVASARFSFHAYRGEDPVLRAEFVMVTTSQARARPIPLPAEIRAALIRYQEQCQ